MLIYMHELSIMEGVLDAVRQSAAQNHITRVGKITLVVGKLSTALPESLQFAFEALAREELFNGAILEIEERDIVCRCETCAHDFLVGAEYKFVCPQCGGSQIHIVSGRELYIESYEGEENDQRNPA